MYATRANDQLESTTRRAELTKTYRRTAREYRTKRVKEARDEAKKEIEQYRSSKEEEYKKFEAEVRTPYRTTQHLVPVSTSIYTRVEP